MKKQFHPGLFFLCILSSLFASFAGFIFSFVFIDEGLDSADNWGNFVLWRALAADTFAAFTICALATGLFIAFFCYASLGYSAPEEGHARQTKLFAIRFAAICWLISCTGPLVAAALIYSAEV